MLFEVKSTQYFPARRIDTLNLYNIQSVRPDPVQTGIARRSSLPARDCSCLISHRYAVQVRIQQKVRPLGSVHLTRWQRESGIQEF